LPTLGALLLNPPLTAGTRTRRNLGVAADLLGCDVVEVANLFAVATKDLAVINLVGKAGEGWTLARPRISEVIAKADHLLAAWGVGGLGGPAATRQREQLDFVHGAARAMKHDLIWTLDGQPRHPSRWHQYVSDRHGRAAGASLNERLAVVLRPVPIGTLCPWSVEILLSDHEQWHL
jgi:hypothetical protein